MAATQLNSAVSLMVGGQTSFGENYIVESCDTPDFDVSQSQTEDENGVVIQECVFQRMPRIKAVLKCKTSATPATDFPKGLMCTLSGFETYKVVDAVPSKTKDVTRVNVDLLAVFTNTTT